MRHDYRGGNFITISGSNGNRFDSAGILNAADAQSIDKKVDDGLASKGNVFGVRETGAGGNCIDGWWNNSANRNYNIHLDEETCRMVFYTD